MVVEQFIANTCTSSIHTFPVNVFQLRETVGRSGQYSTRIGWSPVRCVFEIHVHQMFQLFAWARNVTIPSMLFSGGLNQQICS